MIVSSFCKVDKCCASCIFVVLTSARTNRLLERIIEAALPIRSERAKREAPLCSLLCLQVYILKDVCNNIKVFKLIDG
jgi:hypothetical protein